MSDIITESECVKWHLYGFDGGATAPIPPGIDCEGLYDFGCECNKGYPKPISPYNEYLASIPWNYVTSADWMNDCDHPLNTESYKMLYDTGTYITGGGANGCQPYTPPDNIDEYVVGLAHVPGGSPGFQLRSYSLKYSFDYTAWDSASECWRDFYSAIGTYKFAYWISCEDEPYTTDDWYWTPDRVLAPCIPCMEIIGPEVVSISEPSTYTYRVDLSSVCPKDYPQDEDIRVYLSFVGGTAVNGIDFIAPQYITFDAGSITTSFEITVIKCDIQREINIQLSSFINDLGYIVKQCDPFISIIEECGGSVIDGPSYGTCCDFVPKDFISWRDGAAKNLIAPNKR